LSIFDGRFSIFDGIWDFMGNAQFKMDNVLDTMGNEQYSMENVQDRMGNGQSSLPGGHQLLWPADC